MCPDSRSQAFQLAGPIYLVPVSTVEAALRVKREVSQRVAAVHKHVLRELKFSTLCHIFTFWPIESRVTGAGVVPDGLEALSLFAAGHVLAGGCVTQCVLFLQAVLIIPLARG